MAIVLVPDSGAVNANVYASLSEAGAYVETLIFAEAWTKATPEKQAAALVQAARWMDTMPWTGRRTSAEQALAWPRTGVVDQDGFDVLPTLVPRQVREANAEFASRLLERDRAADGKRGMQVGTTKTPDKERQLVPSSVWDMARPFLVSGGGCIAIERS